MACSSPRYSYYFDHHRTVVDTIKKPVTEIPVASVSPHASASANEPAVFDSEPPASMPPAIHKQAVVSDTIKGHEHVPYRNGVDKKPRRRNAAAITGFSLSIIAPLAYGPLALVAFVLCLIGLKSKRKWLAIAGLVLSSIVIVIGLIWLVVMVVETLRPIE